MLVAPASRALSISSRHAPGSEMITCPVHIFLFTLSDNSWILVALELLDENEMFGPCDGPASISRYVNVR